jgi:hypothetical protein
MRGKIPDIRFFDVIDIGEKGLPHPIFARLEGRMIDIGILANRSQFLGHGPGIQKDSAVDYRGHGNGTTF